MTFSRVWEDVFAVSRSVGGLTHTEWRWDDRLWALPLLFLQLFLFPRRTFTYVDPHPPWKSRMKIREMRWQIPGSPRDMANEKSDGERTKKKEEGGAKRAKRLTVMRSVWLLFTADGHINLTAIKSGQAFTTGGHQMQLRSQIAPRRHFTL